MFANAKQWWFRSDVWAAKRCVRIGVWCNISCKLDVWCLFLYKKREILDLDFFCAAWVLLFCAKWLPLILSPIIDRKTVKLSCPGACCSISSRSLSLLFVPVLCQRRGEILRKNGEEIAQMKWENFLGLKQPYCRCRKTNDPPVDFELIHVVDNTTHA